MALLALTSALAVSTRARELRADVPVDARRSAAYYASHWAGSGAGFAAALLLDRLSDHAAGFDWDWFPGDLAVRAYFRESAAAISDSTLTLAVVLPAALHTGVGVDRSFGNAAVVYAEVHASQVLLNALVKHTIARPRPYTHSQAPHVLTYIDGVGVENYVSFYSGHTGSSFAAAAAGSYLFTLRSNDRWARRAVWGSEFALASSTATLRVIAGRHYFSDVFVGALIGAGIGFGVPILHGYELPADELRGDIAAGAIGLGSGIALAGALTAFHAWDDDVRLDVGGGAHLHITALGIGALDGGADGFGISAQGSF